MITPKQSVFTRVNIIILSERVLLYPIAVKSLQFELEDPLNVKPSWLVLILEKQKITILKVLTMKFKMNLVFMHGRLRNTEEACELSKTIETLKRRQHFAEEVLPRQVKICTQRYNC